MMPLEPYRLPRDVLGSLLALAKEADLLLLGELHGTQEVPRLVLGLLPALAELGYRGLALEVGRNARQGLVDWVSGIEPEPPEFFARPWADGRGNVQTLSLVHAALARPEERWRLLCFDQGPDQVMRTWTDRDRFMADNLGVQWTESCPGGKVLGVCGNLHARVTEVLPAASRAAMQVPTERFWPSFASWMEQLNPHLTVRSTLLIFHAGAIFNMSVRPVGQRPALTGEAEFELSGDSGYSAILHLPRATPATFLAPPRDW